MRTNQTPGSRSTPFHRRDADRQSVLAERQSSFGRFIYGVEGHLRQRAFTVQQLRSRTRSRRRISEDKAYRRACLGLWEGDLQVPTVQSRELARTGQSHTETGPATRKACITLQEWHSKIASHDFGQAGACICDVDHDMSSIVTACGDLQPRPGGTCLKTVVNKFAQPSSTRNTIAFIPNRSVVPRPSDVIDPVLGAMHTFGSTLDPAVRALSPWVGPRPPRLPPWEVCQRGASSRQRAAFRRDQHQKTFT